MNKHVVILRNIPHDHRDNPFLRGGRGGGGGASTNNNAVNVISY